MKEVIKTSENRFIEEYANFISEQADEGLFSEENNQTFLKNLSGGFKTGVLHMFISGKNVNGGEGWE